VGDVGYVTKGASFCEGDVVDRDLVTVDSLEASRDRGLPGAMLVLVLL